MKIYLIGYGNLCKDTGTEDADLSFEDRCQAALVGERLAEKGIQVVYSASLKPAVQTAQAANVYWNAEHKTESDLGNQKAMSVLEKIVRQPEDQAAIVVHGDIVRCMVSAILGMEPEKRRFLGKDLKNCSITELCFDRETCQFELIRFNDYAHLERHRKLL